MSDGIQTSTPLIYTKFLPPPPRKLWSADSPMEQLYRNKWTKYRNSISDKDPWSALDSPHFVDFKELPEVEDNYFDDAETDNNSTPQRFHAQQRLPGFDFENNNILEDLEKCTLSAIKPQVDSNKEENSYDQSQNEETIKPVLSNFLSPEKKNTSPTSGDNIAKNLDELKDNGEKKLVEEVKIAKKVCTIVEPFSFENREKFRQQHIQARRERDSIGREMCKGFRATPLPNFLKPREKIISKAKTCVKSKDLKIDKERNKAHQTTEVWKKKAFQPAHSNKLPIVPKPPNLMTAARAIQRQRFEEYMKKKDLERQELKKKEEAERKKREEEEIAKLRRELVHKAQPIRKYKIIIPKVTKRELADPTVPTVYKRQRKF